MENGKRHALGFTLGAIATCGASTFSNPFEVVKTRLQLQGELKTASPYRGATHAFWTILRTEGLRGIQRGLIPGYSYQFIMNGARFGTYEPLKKIFGDHGPVLLIAGALSGSFGAFLASPLFLIKTVTLNLVKFPLENAVFFR
jgi:solute carrier family 25 protein 34/35